MKITFSRVRIGIAAGVTAVAGIAGTTITTQAVNVQAVQCPGTAPATAANGSSLQNAGVQAELGPYGTACPGAAGTVTYTATGSGTCINEADTNSAAVAFCGTDVPYSHTDYGTMNSTGWGRVQTIPIAVSAVAYVTSTSNCASGANLSGAVLGQIFAGKITDWNAVSASCPVGTTIDVGVRSNACSGTTAAVKAYLTKKDPADFATIKATDPCGPTWAAAHVTCSASTNQALINCTSDANLITFVDESDATTHTPAVARHAIDNAAGAFSTWSSGACSTAALGAATPNNTAADWSGVDITNSASGYGDCTFTYQLASAGCTAATGQTGLPNVCHGMTSGQALNTRGFIEYEVSDAGQATFTSNNYDALPANLQAHSQAGAGTL